MYARASNENEYSRDEISKVDVCYSKCILKTMPITRCRRHLCSNNTCTNTFVSSVPLDGELRERGRQTRCRPPRYVSYVYEDLRGLTLSGRRRRRRHEVGGSVKSGENGKRRLPSIATIFAYDGRWLAYIFAHRVFPNTRCPPFGARRRNSARGSRERTNTFH